MLGDGIMFAPQLLFRESLFIGFRFGAVNAYDLMSCNGIGDNPIFIATFVLYRITHMWVLRFLVRRNATQFFLR